MDILEKQRKLEEIIKTNDDLIGNPAKELSNNLALKSAEEFEKNIADLQNENRLLRIGIIGKVKAGKSSLLNALVFNGQNVLPKAATPMTAALTVLTHGDNLSMDVEFFTEADIHKIREKHSEYMRKKAEIVEEGQRKGVNWNVEKEAERVLEEAEPELAASYELYEKIKMKKSEHDFLGEGKRHIEVQNTDELSTKLREYVAAEGKFMPFTKSVHIRFPYDELRNVEIVDTPGIDDPVISREQKTRELLRSCDVVIVLSPSGQFLSEGDIKLLHRIARGEGIKEFYIVASKIDNQLFGHVINDFRGDFDKALEELSTTLYKHVKKTAGEISEENLHEVSNKLNEMSKENFISISAMADVMLRTWTDRENWDEGLKKIWENLTKYYPHYFSEGDEETTKYSLKRLSNIAKIYEIIADVRKRKEEIQKERIQRAYDSHLENLSEYYSELIRYVSDQISKINRTNIGKLREKKEELKYKKEGAESILKGEFKKLVENLRNDLKGVADVLFDEAQVAKKEVENTLREKEEFSYIIEIPGVIQIGCIGRRVYKYLWTPDVKRVIERYVIKLGEIVNSKRRKIIKRWKDNVSKGILVDAVRKYVDDEYLDEIDIRRMILNILNTAELPDASYYKYVPNWIWTEEEEKWDQFAEGYIKASQEAVFDIFNQVKENVKNEADSLAEKFYDLRLTEAFLGKYISYLEELETEIENKENTLRRLEELKRILEDAK